jgi:hypothetical protein
MRIMIEIDEIKITDGIDDLNIHAYTTQKIRKVFDRLLELAIIDFWLHYLPESREAIFSINKQHLEKKNSKLIHRI